MTKKYGKTHYRQASVDEATEVMFKLMTEHAGKYNVSEWSVAFTSALLLRRDIANFIVDEDTLSSNQTKRDETE